VQLHPLGRLFCPRCRDRRLFIGYDDPDPSAASCSSCSYQFGYRYNASLGRTESVLSRDVVARARAEYQREREIEQMASGITPEIERARGLLQLPLEARQQAVRAAGTGPASGPAPNWTPDQWRSFQRFRDSLPEIPPEKEPPG